MNNFILKNIGVVSVLSPLLFHSCNHNTSPEDRDNSVKVRIEVVSESDVINLLNYVGTIGEKSSTALSFSTIGTIETILVSEGDYVSRGQLLARLDPVSAQSMLNAAEASLKQAKDAYNRLKSVYDKGSLPEIQMVDIETRLHQAESAYGIAKNNLDNCSLFAPSAGVIGKKYAEAGENVIIGKTVLTIMDVSSVKIKFSVPESEISTLPSDCRSKITVASLGDKQFYGTGIEKSVSANMITHTYPVTITLPNPKRELLPGMACKVEINPGNVLRGIIVPVGLIQNMYDGRKFIWSDKDGRAKRIIITTGSARGNGILVTSGLSAGDRIITEGFSKVSEDDKIDVQ